VRDDPFVKVLRQVGDRKADPRVVVLVAHGLIELMINTLVDHSCRNAKAITSDTRGYPYSTKLVVVCEKGVVSNSLFEALEILRRLRSDAALQPFFDVDGRRIRQLAATMEKHLATREEGQTYPYDSLNDFWGYLVHGLFSQIQGVLLPIFAPCVHKALNDQQSHAS